MSSKWEKQGEHRHFDKWIDETHLAVWYDERDEAWLWMAHCQKLDIHGQDEHGYSTSSAAKSAATRWINIELADAKEREEAYQRQMEYEKQMLPKLKQQCEMLDKLMGEMDKMFEADNQTVHDIEQDIRRLKELEQEFRTLKVAVD